MPLSYIFSLCGGQKPWSPCVDSYCIHSPGLNNRQWWWFGFLFLQGVAVASASGFLCCAVDDTEMHMIANEHFRTGKTKNCEPLNCGGCWIVPRRELALLNDQRSPSLISCLVKLWNWLVQIAVHAKLDWCYFRGFSNVIWKSVPVRQPGIQNWKKSNKDTFCSSSHLTLKIV